MTDRASDALVATVLRRLALDQRLQALAASTIADRLEAEADRLDRPDDEMVYVGDPDAEDGS